MSWEESRIDRLKELQPDDVHAFQAQAIGTAGAVVDEYKKAEGADLAALAGKVGLPQPETAKVLASVICHAAGRLTSNWLSRHWADLGFFGVTSAFLVGLLWVPIRGWLVPGKPAASAPQVLAARDIAAGAVLKPEDLSVAGVRSASAKDIVSVFTGATATLPIPQGSVIKPGMLGEKSQPARLLTIGVNHIPPLGTSKLPLEAEVIFSSRQNAPAGAVFKVTLLDLSPAANPTSITFRLAEKDLVETAKWIGSSDVTISFPQP